MIGWNAEYDDLSTKEVKECLKMEEVLKKREELVEALMKFGVDFGYLACKTDNVKYSAVQSKMFYLEKISD